MTDALPTLRWFREFGRAPRILGLDVARGLAIIGMAGAHIGETPTFDWTDPGTWTDLVHGRSSILFAVLAGVSIALMTGRSVLPDPERLPGIRLSLVGRGAVIFVIGLGLELLNTPIAVILTLYGVLYVAVIPFLRWRPWQLLVAAAALALVGPALLALLGALTLSPTGPGVAFVLYGSYPITAWLAFVLGGMALGRLHVETVHTAAVALGVGVVLAVGGYGLGALAPQLGLAGDSAQGAGAMSGIGEMPVGPLPVGGWEAYPQALAATDPLGSALRALVAVEPHSGGTAEILGSGGFALVVIALCLLLSRSLRWPMLPVAALGSMPLTAYTGHILIIVLVSGPGGFFTDNAFWAGLTLTLLLASTLWSAFVGQGPLERLVGRAASAMAATPRVGARS